MGVAALVDLPVQLTPDLERPKITILNFWRAAAPAEMEAELVEPQEAALKTIVGLDSIQSSVRAGMKHYNAFLPGRNRHAGQAHGRHQRDEPGTVPAA